MKKLWPPYKMWQAIIFSSFFSRLLSAVAGHTSTHGVA